LPVHSGRFPESSIRCPNGDALSLITIIDAKREENMQDT
jgi:hypothetical protein